MVNILCWWLAEGYKIEFVPFFSLVFVHTCDSMLPFWDCGTSHFHGADSFLTFPFFPHHLSIAGALPNRGSPSSMWCATLGRSPNLLVWRPWQGLTEPVEPATHPCALLYPASEGTHHWPVGLHALGSVLLPVADLQKSVLLAYPLKRIVQGRLCKSHFTAAGPFHSDICCADGEGATFRMGLLQAPATQEPVSCKSAVYSPSPSPTSVYSYCRTREAGSLWGLVVNHASTESHKGHAFGWGCFLFLLFPCLWHLWGCNDTGCGARPGEKTGFCSNTFLSIFCSMAKRMLERLAVESALKVLPLRCQALLGVKWNCLQLINIKAFSPLVWAAQ